MASERRDSLSTQKLTNCDIEYDMYCCSDLTESLCIDIKKKMNALQKLSYLSKH